MKVNKSVVLGLLRKSKRREYELTDTLRSMMDCAEHFDYKIVPTSKNFKPSPNSVMICDECVKKAKIALRVPMNHKNFTELGYFFSQGGRIKELLD